VRGAKVIEGGLINLLRIMGSDGRDGARARRPGSAVGELVARRVDSHRRKATRFGSSECVKATSVAVRGLSQLNRNAVETAHYAESQGGT